MRVSLNPDIYINPERFSIAAFMINNVNKAGPEIWRVAHSVTRPGSSVPKYLIVFYLFLFTGNIYAQHQKEKTYYKNKTLQSKGSYYSYPVFYDVKTLPKKFRTFGNFKKKENEWRYWYENGQLARIEHYRLVINKDPNDLPDGTWTWFNDQGVKYREDIYKDGVLISSVREIYNDTILSGRITFQNGVSDTTLLIPFTKSDNLVLNPEFDFFYYKPVPIIYHGQDKIEEWIPFWTTPGNYTPDYISNFRFIDLLDYNFLFDSPLPSKFYYAGISLFKEADDYSEYIEGRLSEPLVKGKKYCLRISVCPSSYSKFLVNRLACYLSPGPVSVDSRNEGSFSPQVIFTSLPSESAGFLTLCSWFIAGGGEKSITIGRFTGPETLSVTAREKVPISQFYLERSAYYLIKSVELFPLKDTLDCHCRTDINMTADKQMKPDTTIVNLKNGLTKVIQGHSVVLRNVNFEFNSYFILKNGEEILNALFDYLKSNLSIRISIEGHTDDAGTDLYNLELSERRAKAVYNWLINKGIDPGRLEYKGFGKKNPLVISSEEKYRAVNRRVEVRVIVK